MSWAHVAGVLPNNLSRILCTGVAVRGRGRGPARFIFTSPDGRNWTIALLQTGGGPAPTWPGTGPLSRRRATRARVFTSADGVSWTAGNAGVAGALYGVAWTGSRCVAVGEHGAARSRARTGPPGRRLTPGRPTICYGVAWSREACLVAFGKNGTSWRLAAASSPGTAPARARLPFPADRRPASASASRRGELPSGASSGRSARSLPEARSLALRERERRRDQGRGRS